MVMLEAQNSIEDQIKVREALEECQQTNKIELCRKLCINILDGLIEGYEEIKEMNPEKFYQVRDQIEEIKNQIKNKSFVE